MPNYDDTALQFGWEKKGSKWIHPATKKTYYSAKEIWDEEIPIHAKRRNSINDPWPPPVATPVESPRLHLKVSSEEN